MALGDFHTYAESLARLQTSSNTYQNKLQLVTPVVPAGDYLVTFSFLFQTDVGELNELQARIVEDIAGAATVVYETGELREANPGNAAGDSQDCVIVSLRRTLAAGAHTFDLQFRRTGSVNLVTIEAVRMTFFQLDASYQEASSDGYASTISTSYVLKASLAAGALAAGTYNIRFSVEYNCQDPLNTNNVGLRFRERRDPAGANVITNLLGADAGNGAELELNNGGYGFGSTAPRLAAGWAEVCRELTADTYTYELHYRSIGGLLDDVGVALARINLWRMS